MLNKQSINKQDNPLVAGRAMLKKPFAGMNKKPAKLMTLLLFVSIIAMVVVATPAAKATIINPKFTLTPAKGAVGSTVLINGTGYSPGEPATFLVGNNMFAQALTADANGKIGGSTTVPDLAAGTYHIISYDSSSMTTTATFVVTGGGDVTASPAPTSSSGNGNSNNNGNGNSNSNGNGNGNSNVVPTFSPTSASSSGFFSPIVIGIIVAVLVAFAVSGTLLYSRSSRQKMLLERERDRDRDRMPYGSGPSQAPYGSGGSPSGYGYGPQASSYNPAPSSAAGSSRYTPYSSRQQSSGSSQSRYNQSSSYRPSSYASRYSQPSSPPSGYRQQLQSGYSRPAMHSKTCSHCKRSVREDQNICPYCNKRT